MNGDKQWSNTKMKQREKKRESFVKIENRTVEFVISRKKHTFYDDRQNIFLPPTFDLFFHSPSLSYRRDLHIFSVFFSHCSVFCSNFVEVRFVVSFNKCTKEKKLKFWSFVFDQHNSIYYTCKSFCCYWFNVREWIDLARHFCHFCLRWTFHFRSKMFLSIDLYK